MKSFLRSRLLLLAALLCHAPIQGNSGGRLVHKDGTPYPDG
ncbi:hypothetical protein [Bradyrhizobium sp. NAS80.1]|nr:hypothetical protein [Bradyrhizobium sp. NAS80.1]